MAPHKTKINKMKLYNSLTLFKEPVAFALYITLFLILFGNTATNKVDKFNSQIAELNLIVLSVAKTKTQYDHLEYPLKCVESNPKQFESDTVLDAQYANGIGNDLVRNELEKLLEFGLKLENSIVLFTGSDCGCSRFKSSTQIISNFKGLDLAKILCSDETCKRYLGLGSTLLQFLKEMGNKTMDNVMKDTAIKSRFGVEVDTSNNIFKIANQTQNSNSCSCPATVPYIEKYKSAMTPFADSEETSTRHYSDNQFYSMTSCGNNCFQKIINMPPMPKKQETKLPTVLLGLFISSPTPFLHRYLESIAAIDYPLEKLHVFIYNGINQNTQSSEIANFIESHSKLFASVFITTEQGNVVANKAIEHANELGVDYYFYIDADARLANPAVLRVLIEQDKPVISPYLPVPYKMRSNYWGKVNKWGKARRGNNSEIFNNATRIFSVPCVSTAYLVNMSALTNNHITINYPESGAFNFQAPMCQSPRDKLKFYLSTQQVFGHMIYTTKRKPPMNGRLSKHNELYDLWNNRIDWELSYLHPQWRQALQLMEQPCPDVFWFPLLSPKFCRELIELMEDFADWAPGTNYVPADGEIHPNKDPYPTVDVDLKRVGLHGHWLDIVNSYVRPIQKSVFGGLTNPPFIDTTIVIRYRPEEQSSNRPHHDTSTYTINLALNDGYEGGGCNFIRQNCSVTESRIGWVLIHPGELTHFHEGLSTTKGTRYILVSFVDPREKDRDVVEEEE